MTSIGQILWRGMLIFLSSLLAGQEVGIEQATDHRRTVAFGSLILGHANLATLNFEPAVYWRSSPITPVSDSPVTPV